jgi:hypothetical protein
MKSPLGFFRRKAKIREGKGAGYEQWAKIFNIRQAAKTLIFLQEQGIDSYEDLKKSRVLPQERENLSNKSGKSEV